MRISDWSSDVCSSDLGAAGFMRAIAKAVGRYEITANCVALSTIRTPGVASMIDEDALGKILKSYVIRRLGETSDAAGLILFLASGAAAWITGQTYPGSEERRVGKEGVRTCRSGWSR